MQRYFQPQCMDVAKAFMLSGGIEIALVSIVFIMLVFAATYNNMYNPPAGDDGATKEKYLNGLIITSTVFCSVLLIIGIWHVYVSGKARKCIESK